MDEYETSPSVTSDGAGFSAWALSRVGVAIDAYVDRAIRQPQYLSTGGQQYGVDDRGNLYPLGQTNGQIVANVQTKATISPVMLLLIGAVIIMAAK